MHNDRLQYQSSLIFSRLFSIIFLSLLCLEATGIHHSTTRFSAGIAPIARFQRNELSLQCIKRSFSVKHISIYKKNEKRNSLFVMSSGSFSIRKRIAFAFLSRAAFATVGGGILSGGLHAISGPDHLAAILPRIMGKSWTVSSRIGAIWGLGHGVSATLIGIFAYFLKDKIGGKFTTKFGLYTEALVGFSLITIGLLGIKESILEEDHKEDHSHNSPVVKKGQTAIFLNGLIHGFSWDGAPSLAPALGCSTWQGLLCFLLAYCGGTMATMSVATSAIGEGSVRVGQILENPNMPKKLSAISSIIAIIIGSVWLVRAFLFSG